MWAEDVDPYYTLDGTKTGGTSAYDNGSLTQDPISWTVQGNTTMDPWRIGGKNITSVERIIQSTTAMETAISSIKLTVGAASSITVNSLTLVVASDADFTEVLDEVSGTFAANSTIAFEPTSGSNWAKDAYYKFVFNVSVSGRTDKFVEFSQVEFYEYTGGDTDPSISANNVNIAYDATNGSIGYCLANATGNVTASVTTGGDWLSVGTVTASAVPFTCSANTGAKRTATVTLSFTGANDNVVTVTQAAVPSPVPVTIGATGWATLSSGYALDFENATPAGLNAYMVTGASGTAITKSDALDNVPASTGLLLNGTANTTYTIPVLASSSTNTTGNLMKVVVTATTVNYNDNSSLNYVLAENTQGKAEFQKIVSGTYGSVTIPAGKAYLALTADPGAPTLSIDFNDATGIENVNRETITNNRYFNLNGQRVAQPTKGLYIVNGKKVIVK